MGFYERDYTREGFKDSYQFAPQMRLGFPSISPVVKWLLIINTLVFLVTYIFSSIGSFSLEWFSVYPETLGKSIQFWRLITYQFLHNFKSFGHIFWNMLTLFFFGPLLERLWGSRRFLIFYLICGAAGGILYPLLVFAGWLSPGPLIGASGAILGLIAAGALLFPSMRVFIFWGLFPVPLILLAVVFAIFSILTLLKPYESPNAGGEAAHLAGMVAGVSYVLTGPVRKKLLLNIRSRRWKKKIDQQQQIQVEVDRILEKVYRSGIHSLSTKEKRILKKATRFEQIRKKAGL